MIRKKMIVVNCSLCIILHIDSYKTAMFNVFLMPAISFDFYK